jgi:hypothetical protein
MRDLEYEKNNRGYDSYCPDEGIKCKNYEICNTVLPDWWFDCKNSYLCTNCHMLFGSWGHGINRHEGKGILDFKDNIECPICLEIKRCVSQPRCIHMVCITCFKRCHYGADEPKFPYNIDIEDEYYEDQDNSKWDIDYPLIKIYNEEYNKWEKETNKNEKYLQLCPMCRK